MTIGRETTDEALGDRKSDNNKNSNKNNVRGHWGPISGSPITPAVQNVNIPRSNNAPLSVSVMYMCAFDTF